MTIVELRPAERAGRDRFTSRSLGACRFIAQRALLAPLVHSTVRVRVHGRQHVEDLAGSCIVVANHSSHLDAPLLLGALPQRLVRRLAVGAAADYFFTTRLRRAAAILFFNAFEVHRSTAPGGRNGTCGRLLGDGVPVLVFPEGTRSRTGEIGSFKPGTAALSIKQDVPCLPVAIVGAHAAMPPGRALPVGGRPVVDVRIGAPMRARVGESPAQFASRLSDEVRRLGAGPAPQDSATIEWKVAS